MVALTRTLASFASELSYQQIPRPVIEKLKLHVLDSIGCGIFGSTIPWTRTVTGLFLDWGGKEEATIWGRGIKVPCTTAALVNGMAVHCIRLDDNHTNSATHPGAVAVPSAFAVAERTTDGVTGKDLLAAVLAGYEIQIRIGLCIGFSHTVRGFHQPSTCGIFGAVVAAGKLLHLDVEEMVSAFHIAATQAAGLYSHSMVKRLNPGRAAQSGVLSALLAQKGLRGIDNVLEADFVKTGSGGFFQAFADDYQLSRGIEGLGQSFGTLNAGMKPHWHNFTTLDAIDEIIQAHPDVSPKTIASVVVQTTTPTKGFGSGYEVRDPASAIYSIPFCVAARLLKGSRLMVDDFTDLIVQDKEVHRLSERVEVIANPELDKLEPEGHHHVEVEVKLKDGRSYTSIKDYPKGHPNNPMMKQGIVEKFMYLSTKVLPREEASRILHIVDHIEVLDPFPELSNLLRGPKSSIGTQ